MQSKIRIGGVEKTATLRRAGAEPQARGEEDSAGLVVEYEALSPDRVRLRIDGRVADVFLARAEEGTWVWHEGRARLLRTEDSSAARRGKVEQGPGAVTPPMPATVVRILVQVGDRVEAKAPLVVVSAMKMEATLRAPHAGTVSAIHTQVGATVRPGEILVDLAAEG